MLLDLRIRTSRRGTGPETVTTGQLRYAEPRVVVMGSAALPLNPRTLLVRPTGSVRGKIELTCNVELGYRRKFVSMRLFWPPSPLFTPLMERRAFVRVRGVVLDGMLIVACERMEMLPHRSIPPPSNFHRPDTFKRHACRGNGNGRGR